LENIGEHRIEMVVDLGNRLDAVKIFEDSAGICTSGTKGLKLT